jgi:DNA processing protein
VGPGTFRRLMAEHDGCAAAALDALPRIAAEAGIDDYAPCSEAAAARELEAGRRAGAVPLLLGHAPYPEALAALDDAPPMLWARGRRDLLSGGASAGAPTPLVAMVGARNASSLGLRMARALARGLGEAGLVSVSGLARGIDAEAHRAGLPTGTIAVVAGGIDVVYPQENAQLTEEIAAEGLILSEMPPGTRPQARHFPRRNRIVAGLAAALVVIEAAAKSGSLITARAAGEAGREVLAVPGHPLDPRAAGCNRLIRDGATLVQGAQDVLDALAPLLSGHAVRPAQAALPLAPAPSPARPRATAAPRAEGAVQARAMARHRVTPERSAPPAEARHRLLAALSAAPAAEDQVLRDTGLPRAAFAAALTELELDGTVRRSPGGLISRPG